MDWMTPLRHEDAPFVGRRPELERFVQVLEAAGGGGASVVLIEGEAGAGKTRLAQEFSDRASARGVAVVWGRCWEGEDAPRFWPWRQVVRGIAERTPSREGVSPSDIDPDADPFAMSESLLGEFDVLDAPVVVVLDDLHAADEASLFLTRALSQQLTSHAVVLCGTYRQDDVEPGSTTARVLASLGRSGEVIHLAGLPDEDVTTLFEAVTGMPPPRSLAASVQRVTGGNPFFVQELARQAAAEQSIQRPDRSVGFRVPTGVRELIGQRLDRFSEQQRDVLRAAAVLGYEFDSDDLQSLLAVERDELLEVLSDPLRVRILEEKSALGRYAFTHLLFRDVLYEELSVAERTRLHIAAAAAIEKRASEPSAHLGDLAQHYFKAGVAGDLRKALDFSTSAGRGALARREFDDAARHLHRALKVAVSLGIDDEERNALAAEMSEADAKAMSQMREGGEPATTGENSFVREGDYWKLSFAGITSRLKDSKGMRHLAELLRNPGKELLALDLVTPRAGTAAKAGATRDAGLSSDAGGAVDILDEEAKAAYKNRLEDLEEDLRDAEANNDPERAARAREEIEFLAHELATSVGLAGRSRKTSSATDRARMSVTRALRVAIDRIGEVNPPLGRHLDATVKTGTYVSYSPDPRFPPDWQL